MRRTSINRRSSQAGFTVVEMIVATALLGIGVVAAVACISAATHTMSIANENTTAGLLAQQKLAETESQLSTLNSGQQSGDFSPDHPDYNWTMDVESAGINNLVQVTLVVSWRSGSTQRQTQFVTYERLPTASETTGTGTGVTGTGQ